MSDTELCHDKQSPQTIGGLFTCDKKGSLNFLEGLMMLTNKIYTLNSNKTKVSRMYAESHMTQRAEAKFCGASHTAHKCLTSASWDTADTQKTYP